MKHVLAYVLALAAILILGCTLASAQGTAQISGTIADVSGARLPGVEVTVTQTATGAVRTIVSNETGSYVLPNLATGPYRLSAALLGVRSFVQSGIVLEVNSNPVINITLDVGQVTETVEVQANAALVETRSVGVAQLMESRQILELPLNGRNVTELYAVRSCRYDGYFIVAQHVRPTKYPCGRRYRRQRALCFGWRAAQQSIR